MWKKDEIFKKVSFSEILKLENVTGNNSKAEANMAGITPAALFLMEDVKSHHHTFYFPFVFLDN